MADRSGQDEETHSTVGDRQNGATGSPSADNASEVAIPPSSERTGGRANDTPHPVLISHYGQPEERQPLLTELFDASAEHYDWINHVLSFGTGEHYRSIALRRAGLAEGMQVVDVACGTGVISQRAARIVGDSKCVVSVDPSPGMRRIARQKRGIEVIAGAAENLPVPDASADFLVMGYALRHVDSLQIAFDEFYRVLRPGGRLLILDITAPRSRVGRFLARCYLRDLIPAIGKLFSRNRAVHKLWTYHWDSIEKCVPPEKILGALEAAGFSDAARRVEIGLFSEYTAVRPGEPNA